MTNRIKSLNNILLVTFLLFSFPYSTMSQTQVIDSKIDECKSMTHKCDVVGYEIGFLNNMDINSSYPLTLNALLANSDCFAESQNTNRSFSITLIAQNELWMIEGEKQRFGMELGIIDSNDVTYHTFTFLWLLAPKKIGEYTIVLHIKIYTELCVFLDERITFLIVVEDKLDDKINEKLDRGESILSILEKVLHVFGIIGAIVSPIFLRFKRKIFSNLLNRII